MDKTKEEAIKNKKIGINKLKNKSACCISAPKPEEAIPFLKSAIQGFEQIKDVEEVVNCRTLLVGAYQSAEDSWSEAKEREALLMFKIKSEQYDDLDKELARISLLFTLEGEHEAFLRTFNAIIAAIPDKETTLRRGLLLKSVDSALNTLSALQGSDKDTFDLTAFSNIFEMLLGCLFSDEDYIAAKQICDKVLKELGFINTSVGLARRKEKIAGYAVIAVFCAGANYMETIAELKDDLGEMYDDFEHLFEAREEGNEVKVKKEFQNLAVTYENTEVLKKFAAVKVVEKKEEKAQEEDNLQ